ncbi:3-oxoacyl-ACP synthase III family protein [Marinithermus hydrothermalis]|uniref:3-oxoacyl-(Acyl-carrier-protein) synthase 3 n=1 Tax=Marinithermus hydrothermalis (strain DSM 14884 / JCM 11576 / T1) TaxID=869210 RepID=F2NR33_MARHT|nr:beta-ketoacyl-ACP synthase 3 [Marinithermus hydrothermalis]AEB12611.1 3-oxoacyl-(acyl-carrier-protein) synthase 3 [Marinithermus hydrothermalis DSM 14884]
MSTAGAAILGVGAALPRRRVASAATERALGLPPGWIVQRTGVLERPVAALDEATSDLAVRAAQAALVDAGLESEAVDLLLLATSTPDHPLPPTAPVVAHRLGLVNAGAVDLAGACAGFVYALALADAQVRAWGGYVLVVAANVLSRRVNPRDPNTAPLFADGAGAVILGPGGEGRGLLASHLGADGSRWDTIYIPAGGSRVPLSPEALARGEHRMRMKSGPTLFRRAARGMAEAGRKALARAGLEAGAVDWWVPHQANRRLVHEAGRLLGIPPERTVDVIARMGNSSAATIPIALAAVADRFRPGDVVLLTAVGAGVLVAGAVLRW